MAIRLESDCGFRCVVLYFGYDLFNKFREFASGLIVGVGEGKVGFDSHQSASHVRRSSNSFLFSD